MQRWYTLHTKPHRESHVEAALTARGIPVYLPSVFLPQRHHRNGRNAFFPSYLFVQADTSAIGLWSLLYLPDTRELVMFGKTPTSVNDRFIQTLRRRLAQTPSLGPGDPHHRTARG